MSKNKSKINVLLMFAIVLTMLAIAFSLLCIIFLSFNVGGITDVYGRLLSDYISPNVDVSEQVTFMCIDNAISIFINVYFVVFYIRAYRSRIVSPQLGRMLLSEGIFQMILSSFLAGLFAVICGVSMGKQRAVDPTIVTDAQGEIRPDSAGIPDHKFEAMKEAINRLNELKAKGAISEEEYYANLNKILEG